MNVTTWCNRIIRWGFYLLFVLVPLILTPWNFELFEYNKMMLTYGITVLIVGAWAVKMIHGKEIRITRTPLDIPLWLFVGSQLVSTLFSIDPHVSWFGYYSRFNGGMLSVLTYIGLYYAFVTNFGEIIPKAHDLALHFRITRLVKVILTTAAVISLYGVLEHFGVDKNLWVQDVQSRVFSTLGQPNWLAAYLVALIPVGFAISFQDKKKIFSGSNFYLLFSILFFIVLLFTRSRSGYLGLAVADIVFITLLLGTTWQKKVILPLLTVESLGYFLLAWPSIFTIFVILCIIIDIIFGFLLYRESLKNKQIAIPVLFLHLIFAGIVFFNGVYVDKIDSWVTLKGWSDRVTRKQVPTPKPQVTPPGTALEAGGTESGTIRKYVWQGAVNTWQATTKNMLIGTGTETFAFAFYRWRPAGHNLTSEWDFLYNKAHNEYLNYLATTGLFGLGSYLLFTGAFIIWFMKQKKDPLGIALFSGWVSILVTNFFGFSVVIVQLFLFLFPAMIFVLYKPEAAVYHKPLRVPVWTAWIVTLASVLLLVGIFRFWKADTLYASANRQGRSGQSAQAQSLDMAAIALNPGEPTYHDDLASILATLTVSAVQEKNSTLAAQLAKQSLAESTIAVTTSPQNVNYWKTRTKLFYTFSAFDPTLNKAAIDALEKAAVLSPNDPKIYYNLAILYGRSGNNDKAIELLNKAKSLKADYRDAYFGLYVFYTELKKPDLAKNELRTYLTTVDPNDKDFRDRMNQP